MTDRQEDPTDATRPGAQPSIFVVVPAFNEADAIGSVLRELTARYPNVVVVDDGSSDETARIAAAHAPFALRHVVNRGQGAALQTGLEFALSRGAAVIVTFDADGQHRVEDIAAMTAPILDGACDVTLGSRFLGGAGGVPLSRRLLLRGAVLFTRLVGRISVTDAHNGLRAFSRAAARRINVTLDGMAHASELLDQIREARLRHLEVPVEIRYTDYSLAKGQRAGGAFRILVDYLVGKVLP